MEATGAASPWSTACGALVGTASLQLSVGPPAPRVSAVNELFVSCAVSE